MQPKVNQIRAKQMGAKQTTKASKSPYPALPTLAIETLNISSIPLNLQITDYLSNITNKTLHLL